MKLSDLITKHKAYFDQNEKSKFDRARRYYRGAFYHNEWDLPEYGSDADRMRTQHNMIFAMTETAIVNLLGSSPQVGFMPANYAGHERGHIATAFAKWCFRTNDIRQRGAITLVDAITVGRGGFKTGYDAGKDQPVTREIDPAALFFDRGVRHIADSSYWLESTVVPRREFQARIASGMYPKVDAKATKYPEWMLDANRRQALSALKDAAYFEVWEYYDLWAGKLVHYLAEPAMVLYEEPLFYSPYDMFVMNVNGVDAGGLSEVELTLGHQEKTNDMLTLATTNAYKVLQRILYDSGAISTEDLNGLVSANVGDFVPINVRRKGNANLRLESLFAYSPEPKEPRLAMEMAEKYMELAGHTSALAEASRGRIVNARTATEVASIEQQQRTRLSYREANFFTALEGVASKQLMLAQKYMKDPKFIKVAGGEHPYRDVTRLDLADIEGDFEINAYNGMRNNPMVLLETIQQLMPTVVELQQMGYALNIDVDALLETALQMQSLPAHVFRTDAEVEKIQQEMQQAMQPPPQDPNAMPGGPGQPPLPPEGMMPPEALPDPAGGPEGAMLPPGDAGPGGAPVDLPAPPLPQ